MIERLRRVLACDDERDSCILEYARSSMRLNDYVRVLARVATAHNEEVPTLRLAKEARALEKRVEGGAGDGDRSARDRQQLPEIIARAL
ncbi:hypothetical protein ADL19_20025 [Streptomyces purpurogeneiscleroticus]|nr:hypothetical protein ADL19_20025 [Streptomyces purpurogeneiscleroticus]